MVLQPLQMQQQQNGPAQQQQQQQQQQQEPQDDFVDPFANLDLALYDDAGRQAIEATRTQMRAQHDQLRQMGTVQQQITAQQQEIERLRQAPADPRQQQQQQQNQEPTFEDEIREMLISEGMDPKVAAGTAKIQAKIMSKNNERFGQQIGQQMAPMFNHATTSQAQQVFGMLQENDTLGMFQIPEVAQDIWTRLSGIAQSGRLIDVGFAQNMARICWAEHVEKHGMPSTPAPETIPFPMQRQQQQQQRTGVPPTAPIPGQNPPQFNYPGYGGHVRQNVTRGQINQPSAMNADEDAAMAATVAGWPVQPKQYRRA